ncbi:MAG: alpha/beta fold hydrolase [Candidatus Dojkabacteria bacterium]
MEEDFSKRSNKIDTTKEYKEEIKESFEDINDNSKQFYLSLSPGVVTKVIETFNDETLIRILHELSKYSPDDLEAFTKKIDTLVNKKNVREIVTSIAISGEIPKHLLNDELKDLLYKEVFKNDPKEILLLNEIEILFAIQGLRYKIQQLLIKHLPQNVHSKYDLTFHDLGVTPEEQELLEKQKRAESTPSQFDDYIVEFKLGVIRKYEPEELIYLGKKVNYYAKLEDRIIPEEITEELEKALQHKHLFDELGLEITMDSEDSYSFHQLRLMGSNYNFAYFGGNQKDTEFHELPKLDDRPVIVMLHGITQNWGNWRIMISALKDKYQIIVPDMNGFGDSSELVLIHTLGNYAAYVSNFLKRLDVKHYNLIGHSAGSFTVQSILDSPVLDPEHAIMISSSPDASVSFMIYGLVVFLKTTSLDHLFVQSVFNHGRSVLGKIQKFFGVKISDKDIRRHGKSSPRSLAELIESMILEYNIVGKKIKTRSKCLIVYGEKDFVVSPSTTQKLAAVFEDVEVLPIPNASHSDPVEILPTKYKYKLLEFLNS